MLEQTLETKQGACPDCEAGICGKKPWKARRRCPDLANGGANRGIRKNRMDVHDGDAEKGERVVTY